MATPHNTTAPRWPVRRADIMRIVVSHLRACGFCTASEIASGLGFPDLETTIAEALTEAADAGVVDAIISGGVWRFGAPVRSGGSAAGELAELLGVPVPEAQERAVRATLGRIRRSLGEEPRRARAPRGRA